MLQAISAISDWTGIDLRHLAALDAIAEERSVSRAARRLGYTQSAVSQQLRALERAAGLPLVSRSPGARSVELTDAGVHLLGHARAVRARLDAARADMDAYAAGSVGLVRVGAVPSVAGALIPPLARELRRRRLRIVLHVFESNLPATLLDSLARGDLDLVLAVLVDEIEGLEATELMRDPYVVLVPADDALATTGRPLRPEDLSGRELIGKDVTSPGQRALESALEALGIDTATRIRAHDAKTVHALVGCDLGVAVIPRLLVDQADPATHALPIDHLVPDRRIATFARKGGYRSPSLELTDRIIRELFAGARDQSRPSTG
jgi:DNA-binding transcriptional LysR family regulator